MGTSRLRSRSRPRSSFSLKTTLTAAAAAALTCSILLLPHQAQAWNTDIHNQIGFMAESFLTPYTARVLARILAGDEPQYQLLYNGSIGRAAAWADAFAHTDEGAYSYQWHWIDSADNPPAYCNVYYNRDCTRGGCVVHAIANQTVRLAQCVDAIKRGDRLLPRLGDSSPGEDEEGVDIDVGVECARALKWVVHFIGDIAQPLHASGAAAGGNGYAVVFNGTETNLHSVWDGSIIYSLAQTPRFSNLSIDPFFSDLVSRIREDTFPEPVASWAACTDPSTPIECALRWARESNRWTCDYVFSQVFNGTTAPDGNGTVVDLMTSGYAAGAYPLVEMQVAKAAVRLGVWLNRVVEGEYKSDREVVLRTNPSWIGGPNGGS